MHLLGFVEDVLNDEPGREEEEQALLGEGKKDDLCIRIIVIGQYSYGIYSYGLYSYGLCSLAKRMTCAFKLRFRAYTGMSYTVAAFIVMAYIAVGQNDDLCVRRCGGICVLPC